MKCNITFIQHLVTQWFMPHKQLGKQGNGARPHIWVAVSSPMLDLMRQARFYTNLMAAISLKTQQLVSFVFVDDTDLCVDRPQVMTSNVSKSMQSVVDHWEGLL